MAVEAGFRSAHALPMRLRGAVIGALNLFGRDEGVLSDENLVAGQALAAVATIAILQQRVVAEARILNEQLNTALTSRVVIEQAKGVLAERTGLSMQAAFEAMRRYARDNNLRLADVAGHVIDRTLGPGCHQRSPAAGLKRSLPLSNGNDLGYLPRQNVGWSAARDPGGALRRRRHGRMVRSCAIPCAGIVRAGRRRPTTPGRPKVRVAEQTGSVQDGSRGPMALDGRLPGILGRPRTGRRRRS